MITAMLRGVEASAVALSGGRHVELPLRSRDWTGMIAHFPVSAARLKDLLPSARLKPVLVAPGSAILSIAAIAYRSVEGLAPYSEVALMAPVLYSPAVNLPALPLLLPGLFRSFGFFILDMPATSAEACELGVNIWGYPKRLAEIRFEEIANVRRCHVASQGVDLLTLDVAQVPAKFARMDFRIYTTKAGGLLRHRLETEGLYGLSWLPGGATLRWADHPIAQRLKVQRTTKAAISRAFASNVESLLYEAEQSFPL